jgi:UDP-glucose 4-epimerase
MREAIQAFELASGRTLRLEFLPKAVGDVFRTEADCTKLNRDTGWKAKTSIAAGVGAQWQWAMENSSLVLSSVFEG